MRKRICGLLQSLSIKVMIAVVLIVLPLNITAFAGTNASIHKAVEEVRMAKQNLADIYMNSLEQQMQTANLLLYNAAIDNPNCIRMMRQEEAGYSYDSAKMFFYTALNKSKDMVNGADGYFYRMERMDDLLITGESDEVREIRRYLEEDFAQAGEKEREYYGWHVRELNGQQYLILVFRADNITVYGAWFNLEKLKQELLADIEYGKTEVWYSEGLQAEENRKQLAIHSEKRGIYLIILLDRREITNQISVYQKIMRVMVAVEILAIPLLYLFLQYLLIRPLGRINEAHRRIENGEQDYRIAEKGNSREYKEAFASFNRMADRLRFYRIENYEKEISRQKMELRNLQLQIRPHFLLNTFNLIYTLVQKKDNDSVQDIILYLSEYFRYIFRSNKELELFGKELDLIQGYIRMASIRYQGMIEMDYDIDPEIAFVRTPPLLIHNFVENSVKYGLKEGEVLHILLRGEYSDQKVSFCISDDGNGMTEEVLEKSRKILSGESELEEQGSHVGLFNSYKRLKYFYGTDASIEVESEPGVMTSVTVCFGYDVEPDDMPASESLISAETVRKYYGIPEAEQL